MKPKITPKRKKVKSLRKKSHSEFQMSVWVPEKGKFETNVCSCATGSEEHYIYPIYTCGEYKPERTSYFIRITPDGKIRYYHYPGSVELEKLSLNLADTVEYLSEGVAKASTSLLGKLRLMTTNRDKIVYIVASQVPEPSAMTGLKSASQLELAPS